MNAHALVAAAMEDNLRKTLVLGIPNGKLCAAFHVGS